MGVLAQGGGAAFDYAALPTEIAKAAQRNAKLIIEEEGRARASAVQSIIKVGGWLSEIKGSLEHGQFLDWVQAEFRWGNRTAQRYMLAAEAFDGKATQVSYLPPGIVYQLAAPSVPAELREEVIVASNGGQAIPAEVVTERLKAAKEAERERRAEEKLTPGQRRYKRKIARTVEQEDRARQKRVAERNAIIAQTVEMLTSRFGDDLPEFVALFKKADAWCLRDALEKAALGSPAATQ